MKKWTRTKDPTGTRKQVYKTKDVYWESEEYLIRHRLLFYLILMDNFPEVVDSYQKPQQRDLSGFVRYQFKSGTLDHHQSSWTYLSYHYYQVTRPQTLTPKRNAIIRELEIRDKVLFPHENCCLVIVLWRCDCGLGASWVLLEWNAGWLVLLGALCLYLLWELGNHRNVFKSKVLVRVTLGASFTHASRKK